MLAGSARAAPAWTSVAIFPEGGSNVRCDIPASVLSDIDESERSTRDSVRSVCVKSHGRQKQDFWSLGRPPAKSFEMLYMENR